MAHTSHFVFMDPAAASPPYIYAIDTIPPAVSGISSAAALNIIISALATDSEENIRPGATIFGNTSAGMTAPILQIALHTKLLNGGNPIHLVHLTDLSTSFAVPA